MDDDVLLVTGYVEPDLDAVACAVAYAELLRAQGRAAVAATIGSPHIEAKFLLDRFTIPYPPQLSDDANYQRVVLVDASDVAALTGKIDPQKVVEIIDHRKINEKEKFPHAKVHIEFVGSAATLITERFIAAEQAMSRPSAILLLGAIISNTIRFQAQVTTDRDRRAADWLKPRADVPESVWREMFVAKSDFRGERLTERLEQDFAEFRVNGHRVCIAQLELVGVDELLAQRQPEIEAWLGRMVAHKGTEYVFLNAIDLDAATSTWVVADDRTAQLLEQISPSRFQAHRAELPLIMRKEIMPKLAEYFVAHA